MADEANVPRQVGIGLRVGYAEDLAQLPDAVKLKHFRIHTAADPVGDPVFFHVKEIVGDAPVLNAGLMVGKVPLFRRLPRAGKPIDNLFQTVKDRL